MGDHDAGGAAAPRPLAGMDEWELTAYRQGLEAALAQAELPRYMLPREELQRQLGEVLAETAERERTTGGTLAHP
jgi:hypothetical protein